MNFAKTLACMFAIGVLPLGVISTSTSEEIPFARPVASAELVSARDFAINEGGPPTVTYPYTVRRPRDFLREEKPAARRVVPRREVWAMDADGRRARRVARFGDFTVINSPEVSPDGNYVDVDGWKTGQNLRDARVLIVEVRKAK